MPHYFQFDARNRILRTALEGRICDSEVREVLDLVTRCAPSIKPAASIVDLSGITVLDVSSGTIGYMAACEPPFPPGVARFFVAPTDLLFGMARMFQMLGGEPREDLGVVRSLQEVYQRLGIESAPQFEPLQLGPHPPALS